jgi:hypothetical protein
MYCCPDSASERQLLDAARVDKLRGAGLSGLAPAVRSSLLRCLGPDATLAHARAWLQRDAFGAAAELGEEEAEVVRTLLLHACDGSVVARFSLPRGLSVECSVRPTECAPPAPSPPPHHCAFAPH